ncbi:MAG: c-type cytochrome [Burkholderiaceae bacterium]
MRSQIYRVVISSLLLMTASVAMAQSNDKAAGNALKGKEIYDTRCSACHSADDNRVGPMHQGVFGRKAGGVKSYSYSEALRKSKVVWSRDTLTAWLANPEMLIPGQRMGYSMDNANDRDDVVAYLATLKAIK